MRLFLVRLLHRLYHPARCLSSAWLSDQQYREGTRGVDLPYWRLPRERREA